MKTVDDQLWEKRSTRGDGTTTAIGIHGYEHGEPERPAASVGTGVGVTSFRNGWPGLECLDFEGVDDRGCDVTREELGGRAEGKRRQPGRRKG